LLIYGVAEDGYPAICSSRASARPSSSWEMSTCLRQAFLPLREGWDGCRGGAVEGSAMAVWELWVGMCVILVRLSTV
jgi:hypothetical protein